MKKIPILIAFAFFISFSGYPQRVNDFELQDVVTGQPFSLSQHKSVTAIVLIFTTNTCPFSKLYEGRIMDLVNQYQGENFEFALVNPHAGAKEGESAADMVQNIQTKPYNLPYLSDADQGLTQTLGISKIPEAVVITSGPTGFAVAYQGAIDNNPQLPQSVTRTYLADALLNVAKKKAPSPAATRSVGCNVRIH